MGTRKAGEVIEQEREEGGQARMQAKIDRQTERWKANKRKGNKIDCKERKNGRQ